MITKLQQMCTDIAINDFPEEADKAKAILDLVEENKMSQQVKDMLPEIQNLVLLVGLIDDWADAFDVIEAHYEDEAEGM